MFSRARRFIRNENKNPTSSVDMVFGRMHERNEEQQSPSASVRVSHPPIVTNTDRCSVLPVCASEKEKIQPVSF
jgi:hypothetical protein